MGLRQHRLANEIKIVLANCFQAEHLRDPRIAGVTITAVKLSGDLQNATVFYRLYDPSELSESAKGLKAAKGHLRSVIAKQIYMRRVPELSFKFDDSLEYGTRVEDLLSVISNEDKSNEIEVHE